MDNCCLFLNSVSEGKGLLYLISSPFKIPSSLTGKFLPVLSLYQIGQSILSIGLGINW